jgi:hypothetical protein
MTIDTTIGNYIFLGVGVVFGYVINANIRAEKETQIYERLDREMRKDLEYYKNLSDSLAQDKAELKDKLKIK